MTILAFNQDFGATVAAGAFENELALHKTLLESTRAIPWKIDWATMRFAYIGPQIEDLLGWDQGSWSTVEDWASRIHEDERERVVNFCVSQSQAGVDHEADYRALTKDGGHVWIRDVVHVVRKPDGEVDSLVGFMFDISERKKAEEELVRLQKELEALSLTDGLTGIANRRHFDQRLEAEWHAARRNGQPLSLILLDIDFFKQFNDRYGHVGGDACLVAVARALQGVARRAGDLVARFGGEEFVVLLPGADAAGARMLADAAAAAIAALRIAHEASAVSDYLTASIGVGTATATGAGEPRAFIDAVDRLLYAAKQNGRNRIENMAR